MIGLQLIQRQQQLQQQQQQQQQQLAADKHATDRHSTNNNNNNNNCKKRQHQQQHEQVFRANLVRIPSKVGSPMVNLSQFAHQQQQQQQRRRRQSSRTTTSAAAAAASTTGTAQTATTTKELAGHNVMEAVAGRSVMIAEPVQRFLGDGKTSTLQDNDEMGHTNNVLLLIDEHTGEAPIVIGQRVSSVGGRNGLMPPVGMAPPGGAGGGEGGGGRAMSKTRQQLELLCAAADYKTISQQHHLDHSKSAAIILAPVVVGRRSHRIQQQQQQQLQLQLQKQHQQQQARYLFGEFAPELASAGVELRQHILRPIGIVEQIPALALAAGQTARPINQISISRSANVSSDGSRRSTSSSSSSSAASSSNSSEKRKSSSKATAAAAAASKYSHHPQYHNGSGCISMLDIAINSSEYTLYEGSRFDAVPEYPIANADYPLSNSQRSDNKRTTGLKQVSPTAKLTKPSKKTHPNKQQQQQQQQQQQLLLKPVCISANERQSINTCDTSDAYCCSDPNCGQYSPMPSQLLNYPVDKKKSKAGAVAGGPMTRSVSCQKIQNISNNPTGCCGSSQVLTINQLIDHHFCQANGHSHPNYLPPLNKPTSSPNNDNHHHNHHNRQDHHHHQQQQQRPITSRNGGQSMAVNNVSARKVAYPSQPRSSSHDSPSGSQTSDLDDQEGTSAAVEQMYESLAAELKAKLGNPQIGPILLPPRDYDTLCRRQGKLDGIEQRRSTNPQLVGPIVSDGPAKKLSNDSSSSGNSSLKSNN